MHWHCEWVRGVSFQSEVLLLYFLSPKESIQFFQTGIRFEGKIKNCHEAIFSQKCSFLLSGALESVKYVIFCKKKSVAIRQSKDEKPFCLVPQMLLCDFKLTSWKKEWKKDAKCLSLNQNPLCTSMKGKEKSSQSAIVFFLHVAYFLKSEVNWSVQLWTEIINREQFKVFIRVAPENKCVEAAKFRLLLCFKGFKCFRQFLL